MWWKVNSSIFQGGAVQVDVGRIRTVKRHPPPIHAILHEENCELFIRTEQNLELFVGEVKLES